MNFLDKHVDETILAGLIAAFALGLAVWLMGTASKKDEATIQEALEIANIIESEPLPEIIIPDPILPRALPPLIEGGEVYFEEL